MSELASQVRSLEPTSPEFSQVLKALAEKTAAIRRDEGKVPYEVFISTLELAGIYPAIEVIVFDKKNNLYLKRRGSEENVSTDEENEWGGKLHIPGTTIFPAKRFEMNFYDLLEREIVGGSGKEKRKRIASLYRSSETVGVALYPEPERKTNGLTVFMKVVIDNPNILQAGFEKTTKDNISEVIEQHRTTVQKVLQDRRGPLLFDSR